MVQWPMIVSAPAGSPVAVPAIQRDLAERGVWLAGLITKEGRTPTACCRCSEFHPMVVATFVVCLLAHGGQLLEQFR